MTGARMHTRSQSCARCKPYGHALQLQAGMSVQLESAFNLSSWVTAKDVMTGRYLCAWHVQELQATSGTIVPAWRALRVLAKYRTCRNFMSPAYIFSRIGESRMPVAALILVT